MNITDFLSEGFFYYFNEICKIPHGSGNTKRLAEYIIEFARTHGLEYKTDSAGNIAIYKDGTRAGEGVILQAHIDMVCTVASGREIDMATEPVKIMCDGEYITADGTTLGADDGIGVAYMLALLDSDEVEHPPLTALFTIDEETGMDGALGLDKDMLRGTRLINIDSEEEGVFTVSCAGGMRAICSIPVEFMNNSYKNAVKIEVSGLKGGHSGIDIDKNIPNAIKKLSEVLDMIPCDFGIAEIKTGDKLNVIPQAASVIIMLDDVTALRDAVGNQAKIDFAEGVGVCTTAVSAKNIVKLLCSFPNGVMSKRDSVVTSSLNIGMARLDRGFSVGSMLRFNVDAEKNKMMEKIHECIMPFGGKIECDSDYPSWEYKEDSPLREIMVKVYGGMYGTLPRIESIHAGLECGLFARRIADLDMVSIGPDLEGVHTPAERMNIKSARRVWEFLTTVLAKL